MCPLLDRSFTKSSYASPGEMLKSGEVEQGVNLSVVEPRHGGGFRVGSTLSLSMESLFLLE